MICWVDVESSGLFERSDHLLEVALVVTDDRLNEVSSASTVVRPVGVWVDSLPMDQVVRDMHEKSGLFAELRAGQGLRRWEAEEFLIQAITNTKEAERGKLAGEVELDYCVNCKDKWGKHTVDSVCLTYFEGTLPQTMSTHWSPKRVSLVSQTPLAGSTVGFDRRWLKEHMPKLEALFSYRSIDVSSIVELAKRWAPAVYEKRPKSETGAAHRALADVRESISYLRYFRDCGFIGGGNFSLTSVP